MSLEQPLVLLAALLLAPYALLRARALRAAAVPYAPLQYRRGPRRRAALARAQIALETLILAGAIVAAAGPHRVETLELVGEDGLDVALCLDISASMQAADFPPNRLEVLKTLARDFVRRGGSHRIAVYAFAKHVFAQTPLTTDHGAVDALIDGLSFDSIDHAESGGTALGDALLAATDGLVRQRVAGRDQVLVLITDGESHVGADPILGARFARERGVRLTVIGVGGDEPVEVYVRGEPFITSADEILTTSLDDAQLEEIAEVAGGRYYRAENADVLSRVFEELARLETTPLEVELVRLEVSRVPALAALLAGLLALWLTVEAFLLRRPLR